MFRFLRKFIPPLARIDFLEQQIAKITDPEFDIASWLHDGIAGTDATIHAKSWAIRLLVMSFRDTVGDAENFMTMDCGTPEFGFYVATIQKKNGKSPAQVIGELEARIVSLEKRLIETDDLQNKIAEIKKQGEQSGEAYCPEDYKELFNKKYAEFNKKYAEVLDRVQRNV